MGAEQEVPYIPTWRCSNRTQNDNWDSLMVSLAFSVLSATKNSEIPNQIGAWSWPSHLMRSRLSRDLVRCSLAVFMEWCLRTRVTFEASWRVLSCGYNAVQSNESQPTFRGARLHRLQGCRVSQIRNSKLLSVCFMLISFIVLLLAPWSCMFHQNVDWLSENMALCLRR
jgi:hypothetical protein